MAAAGRERAEEFSWPRVTAKVDDFYGVVIRRLAARGELPEGYHAAIPPSPRTRTRAEASEADGDEAGVGVGLPIEPAPGPPVALTGRSD
jgi:hypothetical protein